MKTVINIAIFAILFIWQFPQNIIALCILPFMGKKKFIKLKHYSYSFECSKMKGGISLGNFIFVSPISNEEKTLAHEYGHTIDSIIWGPLYLIVFGAPSIIWNKLFSKGKCYYSFYTERSANNHGGLIAVKTNKGCYLRFKPKK